MSATIEQRLESVEMELAALKARLLEPQPWLSPPLKKDWQATVGWADNSKLHEAATKAGEDYRRCQTYEKEIEARGGVGY
jgi:hypothetical protein